MNSVQYEFFDWNRPALNCAADFLMRRVGDSAADFSGCAVVTPTRHAGRRLRELLAAQAAERSGGVLALETVTPEDLCRVPGCADMLQQRLVWVQTLRGADPDLYRALFTNASFADFNAALSFADRLIQLRRLLGSENLTVGEAAERFESNPEPDRWEALARLEKVWLENLAAGDLTDPVTAALQAARSPDPDCLPEELILFFTPDLPPLACAWLVAAARHIPVTVCIHAPPALAEHFGEWGVPDRKYWADANIDLPEHTILAAPDPEALAEDMVNLLERTAERQGAAAVAVPDSDLLPLLKAALAEQNRAVFDPAGEALSGHPLFALIRALCELFQDDSFESFAVLLRHPHYLDFMQRQDLKPLTLLRQLDDFRMTHLPCRFSFVLERAEDQLAEAARFTAELSGAEQSVCEMLPRALERIYAGARPADGLEEAAAAVMQTVRALQAYGDSLSPGEQVLLLNRELASARLYGERSPEATDLPGWAEAAWEDSSLLILAGMHEGCVPESVTGDVFLPDAARTALGLRDNGYLLARDTYLMNVMLHSRPECQLLSLVSQVSRNGDPLKPSRLLFRCDQKALALRVKRLFGEPAVREKEEAAARWNFTLPRRPAPARISVTAFADYLACPLRFYLKHVLRMRDPLEIVKHELDAAEFGTLIHETLDEFGRSELRNSRDALEIEAFLSGAATRRFAGRFGTDLSAALQMQLESVLSRLHGFAAVQAQLAEEGWEILETERKIEETELLPGVTLVGTIDRIDRRGEELRVIDYKTFSKPAKPQEKHLGPFRDGAPEWTRADGKKAWTNLQLPLYALLAPGIFGGTNVQCGYFVLPEVADQTTLLLWDGLDELLGPAHECARRIVAGIQNGEFAPNRRAPAYDDYAQLFYDDPVEIVSFAEGGDA